MIFLPWSDNSDIRALAHDVFGTQEGDGAGERRNSSVVRRNEAPKKGSLERPREETLLLLLLLLGKEDEKVYDGARQVSVGWLLNVCNGEGLREERRRLQVRLWEDSLTLAGVRWALAVFTVPQGVNKFG